MMLEKLPDFYRIPEKTASVARRREGTGDTSPDVASVAQIKSRLSPEKAAAGEDLRHMNRTTSPHSKPLRQYQTRFAGAGGAGGRREPPLQKSTVTTSQLTPPTHTGRRGASVFARLRRDKA